VTGFNPANGATSVSATTTVTATFSEAMNATTINSNTFTLTAPGNTPVAASVAYNAASKTAVLTPNIPPNIPLAGGTVYTARVVGGAAGVKDLAGNALASTVTSSFTTAGAADTTPSTVTSFTPSNGATGVSTTTTVTATFSEAMDASTINPNTFTLTGPNNTAVTASGLCQRDASRR
jgi:hypothetical protein